MKRFISFLLVCSITLLTGCNNSTAPSNAGADFTNIALGAVGNSGCSAMAVFCNVDGFVCSEETANCKKSAKFNPLDFVKSNAKSTLPPHFSYWVVHVTLFQVKPNKSRKTSARLHSQARYLFPVPSTEPSVYKKEFVALSQRLYKDFYQPTNARYMSLNGESIHSGSVYKQVCKGKKQLATCLYKRRSVGMVRISFYRASSRLSDFLNFSVTDKKPVFRTYLGSSDWPGLQKSFISSTDQLFVKLLRTGLNKSVKYAENKRRKNKTAKANYQELQTQLSDLYKQNL